MSDSDDDEKTTSKRLLILIGAAAAVVLVAAAVVVFTMLGGDKDDAPDPASQPGAVVALEDSMTLNLSDGKFLKTNLALQLSQAVPEDEAKAFDGSKARDAAISVLSTYSYAQLLKPENREKAQTTLSQETKKRYQGEVLSVYFTEFVMQ